MSKLEEFYRALIKDPDLEIKTGQTREQAAKQEAEYRARQYHNNEQALSMATEPKKSALDSLFDFMTKEYRGVSDEGIKALHDNLPNKFGPLKYEQTVDRVQTGKNKGNPKLKPDVKPDKQYRYNDKTGKLELFQPRVGAGTSDSPSDWKYKDSDTPSAESIKDFVDGLYGNLQDSGLSEKDVLSYIEQNINNPDWYNSKTEDGVSQKEVIEDYIKRIGVAREVQRLQTSNIPERDNPPSARARALDKIKQAETGVTEEQPSNEKAREIQADTDNYNRIKDSLGNKNKKGARAVWNTPRSPEKKLFDTLPKEIQTVLNDIHSKGKGATRLTPAQQIHLLNKFNEENETSTHTDLYEGMRTDDDKGYNFRHDPSINPESYRDRLNQNKLKFNEDIKQDAMTAVNRFLQSDKNDLDLTDNQIKVLQDSVLEDNLNTILAPVVEAKAQNIKAPLTNPSDQIDTPVNVPNLKKFRTEAEKYFNRKGDELNDILQTMANSGLFDSTIPATSTGSDYKQLGGKKLADMFENDTNPQFQEVRDRLPQILDMTKKRRDPKSKVTTYKLSDLATKIDNEKAIENSNNKNLTQSDEEFEENIVENQKDNTDTSNEVQETIDDVSDKPDDETVNTGSAPTTTSDDDPAQEPAAEEPVAEEPVAEEPVAEEPKVEEPKVEEPKVEEPKVEEPKVEEQGSENQQGEQVDATQGGAEGSGGDSPENKPITEDVRNYMAGLGYKDDQIAGMEEQGLFHPENNRTQTPFEVSDITNLHNETHFDEYLKDNGIDKQGVEVEGSTPETPTIDENIQALINTASSEENGTLKHMYEKEYGTDSDFVTFEEFKANKTEEFQKIGEKKTKEILGKAQKTMKDLKVKENKANKKENKQEKVEEEKQEQEKEKETKIDAAEQKKIDDAKAYGISDSARTARMVEEGQGGSDLMVHFDEEGKIAHETHGHVDEETGEHKHINDHEKKDSGSHPAHHHNKAMSSNMPPALREIEEEQAKEGDANQSLIQKNRNFLQQKSQEGYVWNPNTNHWISKENFSNLMSGHRGTNATIVNGNHSRLGVPTFLDGKGNAAQGMFHLGTGYKVHKFGEGAVGKHLEAQHSKAGNLATHFDSKLSATKVGDASTIYRSAGIGTPPSPKPKGFSQGMQAGKQGTASGFNVTPMVSSIRSFFGLEKGELSNSALKQLVESYSNKNRKR